MREDAPLLPDLWRNKVARWVAYRLPYSVICWCLVRAVKYARDRTPVIVSWAQVMDAWESQEGLKPWERDENPLNRRSI